MAKTFSMSAASCEVDSHFPLNSQRIARRSKPRNPLSSPRLRATKTYTMKNILLLAVVLFTSVVANAQPPKVPADPGTVFGEKTTAENAITVDDMYALLKTKESKKADVKIKGTVTTVCQMEGCWLKVKSPEGNMMVKLKDHKFLVPVILEGKNVVIAGTAEEKVTSIEQLRHYAEDAGKSKEEIAKITQPKREVVMEAKGVLVL